MKNDKTNSSSYRYNEEESSSNTNHSEYSSKTESPYGQSSDGRFGTGQTPPAPGYSSGNNRPGYGYSNYPKRDSGTKKVLTILSLVLGIALISTLGFCVYLLQNQEQTEYRVPQTDADNVVDESSTSEETQLPEESDKTNETQQADDSELITYEFDAGDYQWVTDSFAVRINKILLKDNWVGVLFDYQNNYKGDVAIRDSSFHLGEQVSSNGWIDRPVYGGTLTLTAASSGQFELYFPEIEYKKGDGFMLLKFMHFGSLEAGEISHANPAELNFTLD